MYLLTSLNSSMDNKDKLETKKLKQGGQGLEAPPAQVDRVIPEVHQ